MLWKLYLLPKNQPQRFVGSALCAPRSRTSQQTGFTFLLSILYRPNHKSIRQMLLPKSPGKNTFCAIALWGNFVFVKSFSLCNTHLSFVLAFVSLKQCELSFNDDQLPKALNQACDQSACPIGTRDHPLRWLSTYITGHCRSRRLLSCNVR